MAIAIKAENISKQYRLGYVGSGSLKDDASRWWARVRGKEDPLLTIGETNDRSSKGESDYVWALKDINFEIEQGDTVGIIGRNGAGKSTLLKILSKVTAPTTGNIKVKGRIASLLEVGTGFHGELTGRENIYLNGAIMGMRKHEITRKLDEIVDFAGVERYLDTPVKRYSSGMYVRLGFAVAAHLENEILIVDEVLAVGDAEFQKKCLGKMGDVARGEGRTVLFVSHNISSIQKLCSAGLLLTDGKIINSGIMGEVIDSYTRREILNEANVVFSANTSRIGSGDLRFINISISDDRETQKNYFSIGESINITFQIKNKNTIKRPALAVQIKTADGMPVFHMMCKDSDFIPVFEKDIEKFHVKIDDIRLFPGNYFITLTCASINGYEVYDSIESAIAFKIIDGGKLTNRPLPRAVGLFFITPEWNRL